MSHIDQRVGDNVRRLRLKHQRSRPELAAAIGLTGFALSSAEEGRTRLSAVSLYAIARALDEPASEFFAKVCTPA